MSPQYKIIDRYTYHLYAGNTWKPIQCCKDKAITEVEEKENGDIRLLCANCGTVQYILKEQRHDTHT